MLWRLAIVCLRIAIDTLTSIERPLKAELDALGSEFMASAPL